MRYREVIENTENDLIKLARDCDTADSFAQKMAGRKIPKPRTQILVWTDDNDPNPTATASSVESAKKRYPGKRVEVKHPPKGQVTRYNNYMAKYQKYVDMWNEFGDKGYFDRDYGFDLKDLSFYKPNDDTWTVWWNGMKIGYATLEFPKNGSTTRSVWKTAIDPLFQRRGVGTALYNRMADDLKKDGLTLVPSKTLSDDGYAFWKRRDPEALAKYYKKRGE